MKPHDCVILAIDPGACSGWALFKRGHLIMSGVAMRADQRSDVMTSAEAFAGDLGTPGCRFVVVREDWTVGGGKGTGARGTRWNVATILGMGASWGRWLEQLEVSGMAARRIVRVTPATWRRVLKGVGPTRSRDEAKATAQLFARAKLGGLAHIEPDEAEAIAIGFWAISSLEVEAVLPKRVSNVVTPLESVRRKRGAKW